MPGNPTTTPEKSLLLTDLFSRQFNLGENLPRIITLSISTRKIELAQRKQDRRQISCRNSCKFPQFKISSGRFAPGNFGDLPSWKILPAENSPFPCREMYAYFPNNKYYA